MKALIARGITFSYKMGNRRQRVLRDFNLEIDAGDFVAIQGPSGSGKSTLLYLMGGMLRSDAGEVEVLGEKLYEQSDELRAFFRSSHIGFVFQQFHLLESATVLENILLASQYPVGIKVDREIADQRARKLAGRMGLSAHLDHYPNQLSGGQQQRVAICRALLNEPEIILADEPTGNLDSRTAAQILEIFKEIHAEGKTVVLITHDNEVAEQSDRIVVMRDGDVVDDKRLNLPENKGQTRKRASSSPEVSQLQYVKATIRQSLMSLWQQKSRAALTMLGVVIGVAAMLAMITFGQFAQERVLSSYETMGVNKVVLRGYPNWNMRATDKVSIVYDGFDWETDLAPLKFYFPEVDKISPLYRAWSSELVALGNTVSSDVGLYGIHPEYLAIINRGVSQGSPFTQYHLDKAASVCLIGPEIARGLFPQTEPVGQMISAKVNSSQFTCEVLGVLESASSNSEWDKPDFHIYLPSSYIVNVLSLRQAELFQAAVKLSSSSKVEAFSKAVKALIEQKYGASIRMMADSDAVMLAQLKQFLSFFKILLGSIAAISLVVGGIGITNMMLASLSEQTKEIGVRKALGATNRAIRWQYLTESLVLCFIAGCMGLAFGFATYQLVIYGASKFVAQLSFEWVFIPWAFVLAFLSIFIIGILSGLIPALRAEKLQVIDALRS